MLLEGKTAFITGTNRGIGFALVEKFSQEGATVIAHARKTNAEHEDNLLKISNKYNNSIIPVYFDMQDIAGMRAEVKAVLSKVDNIDFLVNNAGVSSWQLFPMTKVQTIRDEFEVNLFSPMELTQIVLRKMMKQGYGSIVNMRSIAAIEICPGNCAYGVSKAAVKMWTEVLASEVGQFGIRVNAVVLGMTNTDMARQIEEKSRTRDASFVSALKRLDEPEEIANAVIFCILTMLRLLMDIR